MSEEAYWRWLQVRCAYTDEQLAEQRAIADLIKAGFRAARAATQPDPDPDPQLLQSLIERGRPE